MKTGGRTANDESLPCMNGELARKIDTINVRLEVLDKMDGRLAKIETALAQIAVQDVRISSLQSRVNKLEERTEALQTFEASCPRSQFKWLWGLSVALTMTLLALAIKLVAP